MFIRKTFLKISLTHTRSRYNLVYQNKKSSSIQVRQHRSEQQSFQMRGRNRLVIEQHDEEVRHYIEQLMDGQDNPAAQPYLEQLIDNQNNFPAQAHDDEANELNSSIGGTKVQPNDDSGPII